jgi:hypothetical protein
VRQAEKYLENLMDPYDNFIYDQIRSRYLDIDKDFSDCISPVLYDEQAKSDSPFQLTYKHNTTQLEELEERIKAIKSNSKKKRIKKRAISQSELKRKRAISEKIIKEIDVVEKLNTQYIYTMNNCGYLVLTSWPVFLFLIIEYILNLRSILIWPEKIVNKELLLELNNFVHQNLDEIKSELINFLKLSKNIRLQSEMETILGIINSYSKEAYFTKIFYDYSILGLKNEIVSILDSVVKLEKKSVEYDFRNNLRFIGQYSKAILDDISSKN